MIRTTQFVALGVTALMAMTTASGLALAKDKGQGGGGGQAIAPGQSGSSGRAAAPGQTGNHPAHPANHGAAASSCAKIADPKLKDECVRASKR